MARFTFTQKEWDSIRPPSIKKTGIGDAMAKFLKLVPGAKTEGLSTPAACIKAQEALVDLEKLMSTTLALVKKASDDKKNAAGELKAWLVEVERGIEAIKDRKIELVEAETEPARKRCVVALKMQEKKVQDVVSEIKSLDSDAGRAEELLKEAMMAMAERGEELRRTGHTGLKPEDFLDDAEFKKSHKFFFEQVDIITRSNKAMEAIETRQKAIKSVIAAMLFDVRDAAGKAGEYVNLPSQNLREFKQLKADIELFWRESCSDNAKKYQSFCFIPNFIASSDVRKHYEEKLLEKLATLKKIDAEAYFEKELAMHALSQKQLTKAITSVRAFDAQVKDLARSIGEGKGDTAADKKALKRLADTLDLIVQKHHKGRNNMDMIQFLSKKENAEAKTFIDNAIKLMQQASDNAAQAVKDAR